MSVILTLLEFTMGLLQTLALASLHDAPAHAARVRLSDDAISRYADLLRDAAQLPPVRALRDLLDEALAARGTPAEAATMAAYRRAYEAQLQQALDQGELAPGRLQHGDGRARTAVEDGAALCCACGTAAAQAGRCHRAWAAPFAGWRVVLDGQEVRDGGP